MNSALLTGPGGSPSPHPHHHSHVNVDLGGYPQLDQQANAGQNGPNVIVVLVLLAVVIASWVLWIWSIVDAAKRSDAQWSVAGHSKVTWIVLIVLFGILGSIAYVAWPWRRLRRAAASLASGAYPPGRRF